MNPIGALEVPLAACAMAWYRRQFQWHYLIFAVALWAWKTAVPMSVSLHRYFAHNAFKCGRGAQFILFCLACLASQGPPLWWASKHRRHHAYCDTELDPHSPVVWSAAYAWLGWVYLPGV